MYERIFEEAVAFIGDLNFPEKRTTNFDSGISSSTSLPGSLSDGLDVKDHVHAVVLFQPSDLSARYSYTIYMGVETDNFSEYFPYRGDVNVSGKNHVPVPAKHCSWIFVTIDSISSGDIDIETLRIPFEKQLGATLSGAGTFQELSLVNATIEGGGEVTSTVGANKSTTISMDGTGDLNITPTNIHIYNSFPNMDGDGYLDASPRKIDTTVTYYNAYPDMSGSGSMSVNASKFNTLTYKNAYPDMDGFGTMAASPEEKIVQNVSPTMSGTGSASVAEVKVHRSVDSNMSGTGTMSVTANKETLTLTRYKGLTPGEQINSWVALRDDTCSSITDYPPYHDFDVNSPITGEAVTYWTDAGTAGQAFYSGGDTITYEEPTTSSQGLQFERANQEEMFSIGSTTGFNNRPEYYGVPMHTNFTFGIRFHFDGSDTSNQYTLISTGHPDNDAYFYSIGIWGDSSGGPSLGSGADYYIGSTLHYNGSERYGDSIGIASPPDTLNLVVQHDVSNSEYYIEISDDAGNTASTSGSATFPSGPIAPDRSAVIGAVENSTSNYHHFEGQIRSIMGYYTADDSLISNIKNWIKGNNFS